MKSKWIRVASLALLLTLVPVVLGGMFVRWMFGIWTVARDAAGLAPAPLDPVADEFEPPPILVAEFLGGPYDGKTLALPVLAPVVGVNDLNAFPVDDSEPSLSVHRYLLTEPELERFVYVIEGGSLDESD